MGRRPRKPRREFPRIEAMFKGGRWRWRARTRVAGRDLVGSLTDSQQEAHAEAMRLREQASLRKRVEDRPTLAVALDAHLTRAKARRDKAHVEQDTGGAVRFLKTVFHDDTPLEVIDKKAFDLLVTHSLKIGRHPSTVRRYCRILNQALELHGFDRIEVKIPRAPRKPMEFFEPSELAEVLDRMRNEAFSPPPRNRERDVALTMFLAMTGVRGGEFCRLRVADFDFHRRALSIVAKDRANPRIVPITDSLERVARVLIKHADVDGQLLSLDAWRSTWRRWSKRLGIPLNGRKLRHTFVTSALGAGVTTIDVRDLAGHLSLKTTSRYAHAISSRLHDAAERLHGSMARESAPTSDEPRSSD